MAILNEEQHRLVSEAVAEAESRTTGEIVTVIAERSDSYRDIALAWAVLVSFTVLTLLVAFPDPPLDFYAGLHGAWNPVWLPADIFGMAAGIGILLFLLTLALLAWDRLRFALVPGFIKTHRAESRALDLFKVGADRRTMGRTGVLIYLSMREHRAEIVADEAIASKVEPDVWGQAMADMLAEIRKGCIAEGIAAGVRDVGVVLAQHFPCDGSTVNELPDRLIEL